MKGPREESCGVPAIGEDGHPGVCPSIGAPVCIAGVHMGGCDEYFELVSGFGRAASGPGLWHDGVSGWCLANRLRQRDLLFLQRALPA